MRANWQLHGFLTAVLMERNGTAMPQARGKAEVEAKRAERTPALPHGQPRAWAFRRNGESGGRGDGWKWQKERNAVRWQMQRAAMGNAARRDDRCSVLHFPVHFPRQSRAKRTHFSSCLLLHSDQPTLSSSSALFSAPANPRFLSHQHVLRPHETHTPSTASTFVFLCKRTCLPLPKHTRYPQQARLSSSASTLVFLCQSACPHTARAFAFPRQHNRLPQPERSASSANTFVFHNQHVRLPLPARSASPARTLIIRSQPNHPPNRPVPLHPFKQQGQHADVAQHAALAVMVSARQAPVRCGGEP